mmetsp:Transcript_58101/g.108804  ORF Transcript_58101/g.108804 Transcript_58101/m.108804 type:complete len:130 (+) Transcript_58101:71-460(+)
MASDSLQQIVVAEASVLLVAGLYGWAKGSRAAAISGAFGFVCLVAFRGTPMASDIISAAVAIAASYKYKGICAEENNKTVEMARQMKISLMTEDEEALQATSKKIYLGLTAVSLTVCACCTAILLLNIV